MNFSQILVKIFGDKKSRDLKDYQPLVALVTDIYPSIQALSNDELRARTKALQQQIRSAAKEQQDEINSLKASIPVTEIQDRAPIFAKIDQLEKEVLDIYGLNRRIKRWKKKKCLRDNFSCILFII